MHTLEQLTSGNLLGAVSLKISENLQEFPKKIFDLADTLEVLDLSGNQLTELPFDLGRLKKLKILFCSNNLFTVLPEVLQDCPTLEIAGFKANRIEEIPAKAINPNLKWLILTDNKITSLPAEIGQCTNLQKLMLAGNCLQHLPQELQSCKNLALLRISANQLDQLPYWLFNLPRLAWLAFSGNPFSSSLSRISIPEVAEDVIQLGIKLGEGASGTIYKSTWTTEASVKDVAIKVFKGKVTSDGFPIDEMNAYIQAGNHYGIVKLLAHLSIGISSTQAVMMDLIPSSFYNLGNPPSLETCTRDVFDPNVSMTISQTLKIARTIASVATHLHKKGIMHGDLYAHNILVDHDGNTLFGDFGAASLYNTEDISQASGFQRIELRAFGYLLDDLITLCSSQHIQEELIPLIDLRDLCLSTHPETPVTFDLLLKRLTSLEKEMLTN